MNKLIYALCTLAICSLASCSDDDKLPDIKPADRGTVMDDDGNVYNWVRIGDQMWTTSNALNGPNLADEEYYDNFDWTDVLYDSQVEDYEENYLPVYGNLMNYEAAVESAPEGWRLPSDEDWQKLERTLGMTGTANKGWRGAGVAEMMQDKDSGCELGLQLGGGCLVSVSYGSVEIALDWINEYGYFWTSTMEPSYEGASMAYYRKIATGVSKVSRECMSTQAYLSVRWVKDVE